MRNRKYTKFIGTVVPKEMYLKIQTFADKDEESVSQWMRKVLRNVIHEDKADEKPGSNRR
jgi:hypothetical protein